MADAMELRQKLAEDRRVIAFQLETLTRECAKIGAMIDEASRLSIKEALICYNYALELAEISTTEHPVRVSLDMPWKEGLTLLLRETKKVTKEHLDKDESFRSGRVDFHRCERMISDHFSEKRKQEMAARPKPPAA